MFQPLPLFIGLRYSGARAHRFFVSFITWVSLLGVGVECHLDESLPDLVPDFRRILAHPFLPWW